MTRKTLTFGARLGLVAAVGDKPRRFAIEAYNGGTLPVNGFEFPVVVDLAGLAVPPDGIIPLLLDHEISVEATLGQTDLIANSGSGLSISGIVTGLSPRAQQVLAMADSGHTWQASIGLLVESQQMVAAGQAVEVNGKQFTGPIIVARRSQLRETSVLPMGADATTSVNLAAAAAQLGGSAMPTFEEWLTSLGVDPATLDETSKTALMLAYDAMQNPAPATPAEETPAPAVAAPVVAPAAAGAALDLVASMRRQASAESLRIAEVQAKSSGHPMITAKAISEGWSVDKTELAVLRASAAQRAPAGHVRTPDNSPQVLEAALCVARKIPNTEKQYTDQVLQAAHTQYRGRVGLQQIILQAAMQNGYQGGVGERIHNGNLRDILSYAMPPNNPQLRAAFSTVSLPNILSNVANKELLTGYEETDTAWREVAVTKSVSDFKQVTSYRMLDNMEYEALGPAGEIKHGTLGEESYTRQAGTYAKMFSLTRTNIINDDLGAFDDLRNRLGRGSGMKLNKVFWSTFMAALGTLFTSGRTNYISGSTTNLGVDGVGLGLGVTAFRKMTSPSADNTKRVNANPGAGMGGRAEILLVPPELESAAEVIYRNQNLSNAVGNSSANIYANKYRPVVAWQLSNSGYTGYSTTQWFLLNNPSFLSAMVVSFLNGQETPTVEQADADFDTLGIQFRGYHDFGCDTAEYLAGVMSKGAS